MKRLTVILCALSLLSLFLGGAFRGFEQIALDPAAYDRIQAELDVYDYAGLEPEAQSRVNRVLAGYISGELPSIDTQEEVFGTYGEVFNDSEKAHMTDVLHLFRLERAVRTVCLAAGFFLLALSLLLSLNHLMQTALSALKAFALILLLAATAGILLYVFCGFDRLFILFHELLFTNELWLMDPRTDAMIRMFPSEFFLRIAIESGVSALIYGLAIPAAAWAAFPAAGLIIDKSRRKQKP